MDEVVDREWEDDVEFGACTEQRFGAEDVGAARERAIAGSGRVALDLCRHALGDCLFVLRSEPSGAARR